MQGIHGGWVLAAGAALAAGLAACTGGSGETRTGGQGSDAEAVEGTSAGVAGKATPIKREGGTLHNLWRVGPKMISGSGPESDAEFDELQALGVKTIVSVDGSTPAVDKAKARGMRYVHVPVTYAEITPGQRMEIAKAVRDLPGRVYVHCHHGLHRGPAAAAGAAVALGQMTPAEGEAFMKEAGTAPQYAGLYACVASAKPVAQAEMDAAKVEFKEVRKPVGVTAGMVEIDLAFGHLKEIREAGWKTPASSPDLVPAAEAGRLAEALRLSGEDPKVKAWGEDFRTRLAAAARHAAELEAGLAKSAGAEQLEASWKGVAGSCKDCHVPYRNKAK